MGFLGEVKIEAHAATRLRTLPYEYQQAVIARGSMLGNRDATACVMGRISAVTRGALQFSKNHNVWQPIENKQVAETFPAQPSIPSSAAAGKEEPVSDEKDEMDLILQQIVNDDKQKSK